MFSLDGMIDWSFGFVLIIGTALMWAKSQKYQFVRISDISIVLLVIFGAAMGVQYFIAYQEIPWCFGIEKTIIEREDMKPVFFMIIDSIIGLYSTRWLLAGYNLLAIKVLKGRVPTASSLVIGFVCIVFFMHMTATTTAYYYKVTGKDPGGYSYGVVTTAVSSVATFISEVSTNETLVPTNK